MDFQIIGDLRSIEVIAVGNAIRELVRLNKVYGKARWRKLKGIAKIRLDDDTLVTAELRWYEAHGIGKREFKIKRLLE